MTEYRCDRKNTGVTSRLIRCRSLGFPGLWHCRLILPLALPAIRSEHSSWICVMRVDSILPLKKLGESDDDCSGGRGCVCSWSVPGHWLPVEAEDVAAPALSLQQKWQEGRRASSSTTAAAQPTLISPLKPLKRLPFAQNPISWAGPQPGEAQPRLTADMDKYRVN